MSAIRSHRSRLLRGLMMSATDQEGPEFFAAGLTVHPEDPLKLHRERNLHLWTCSSPSCWEFELSNLRSLNISIYANVIRSDADVAAIWVIPIEWSVAQPAIWTVPHPSPVIVRWLLG